MINLINNLTPTQIMFISIGLLLVLVSLKDYIYQLLNIEIKQEKEKEIESDNSLTEIVAKWEDLSNACKKAGLSDAYNKLQEVFPMLVKAYTPRATKKNEQ